MATNPRKSRGLRNTLTMDKRFALWDWLRTNKEAVAKMGKASKVAAAASKDLKWEVSPTHVTHACKAIGLPILRDETAVQTRNKMAVLAAEVADLRKLVEAGAADPSKGGDVATLKNDLKGVKAENWSLSRRLKAVEEKLAAEAEQEAAIAELLRRVTALEDAATKPGG